MNFEEFKARERARAQAAYEERKAAEKAEWDAMSPEEQQAAIAAQQERWAAIEAELEAAEEIERQGDDLSDEEE